MADNLLTQTVVMEVEGVGAEEEQRNVGEQAGWSALPQTKIHGNIFVL
jgi:hypothetical protein